MKITKNFKITDDRHIFSFTDKERLMLISGAKCGQMADTTCDSFDGRTIDIYGPITEKTDKEWDRLIKKLEKK